MLLFYSKLASRVFMKTLCVLVTDCIIWANESTRGWGYFYVVSKTSLLLGHSFCLDSGNCNLSNSDVTTSWQIIAPILEAYGLGHTELGGKM
jgi:hypothetical protein